MQRTRHWIRSRLATKGRWLETLRLAGIRVALLIVFISVMGALFGWATGQGNPNERAWHRDELRLKPFRVGPASRWVTPGVYDDFLKSHGVYLVSNQGMLVALIAQSTEAEVNVKFDPLTGLFECPRSGALYTRDGLAWADSPASRSLERCQVRALGPSDKPDVEILVDPQNRFLFEQQQWSSVMSNHLFPKPATPAS